MNPNHTSMLQPQHTNYQHPPHPHSGHVSGSSGAPGPPQQDHTQQTPEGLEVMHQQQQWAKCEPELSHPHANFGASTTTTSQQFYQQSCYFPPAQMYGSGGGSQQAQQMRPDSTDYANNSAGGFYHHNSNNERNNSNNSSGSGGGDVGASGGTEVGDCRQTQQQYYPTMDHSHQFPYDHSNNGSGHHVHTRNNSSTSCAMTAGNNFYNYYNNQNSHYNVSGYNNNSGGGVGGDEAEYQRRYFDQNQQSQHHHIEGYFGGYGPHPQQNSRYPHPNPHHLQYNNINNSHHPPFRRKSMESASYPTTEGYPTTNSNNSTKSYGVCSFNGNQQNNPQQQQSQTQQQQQQQPQQATYCSPSPAPSPSSSTSPAMMIKRECLSNPSSSMPIPPSGWVRQSTSNSSANSNPNCPSSSTQDYIYTGTNSSPYDQQSQQGQTSQEEYHHHQSTFKSCAFESGSGAPQTEMKLSNSSNNYNLKPGSVKHRSLSIPANYPPNQNDIHMHQVPSSVSGGCGSTVPDSENLEKIVVTSESLQYSATSYDQLNDGSGSGDDAYPTPAPSSNSNSAEECCTTQPQEVEEDDEEESEDEEEDDEDDETSSLLHEFDVDDIPESDMIIAEDEEEEEDGQSHHEDDDQDMEKSFVGETSPKSLHIPEDNANNNVISTTVEGSSGCGGGGEEINSNSNSNTSFTSALFSLKRSNSISCAFSGSSTSNSCSGENNSTNNNNNNAQCDSGIGLSLSFSLNTSASSTTSSSGGSLSGSGASPQKIAKRSFSETDKHVVVVNAFSSSATCGESDNVPEMQVGVVGCGGSECSTNTGLSVTEHKKGGGVAVPKGWKREISFAKELVTVYYVSPSDTKLRNLEELKNYICSDGTCKCGLSCPLRLEHAFSFDPKVISVCGERKKKKLDSEDELMYLTGFKEHDEEIVEEEPKTTLCNHYKRKIPKSEDSPLISSTRDDLGDCPDKRTKKRRTSDSSEFSTSSSGNAGNATPTHQAITPKESPTAPLVNAGGRISHVAVPCSQQSPDTTTQIPQTEMSPASSVSSEPTASSRSLCSTPTPPSSAITTPVKGVGVTTRSSAAKGNDFAWPTTTTSSSATNSPSRKSTHHHLIPTKSKSPCPNVDVRQIPLEKNRPPPKPGQIFPPATEATIINPPPTLPPIIDLNCLTTTSTINSTPISAIISTPSSSSSLTPTLTASHSTFGFNSPLHSFTNSELRELQNLPMTMNLNGMNCGFTISPIMNPTTTMSYLNQPLTIPLEIQKLIGASATPGSDQSNLFQQFHQPQVLFSIPQQQQQIHTQNLVTSVNTVDDKLEKISEKAADSSESKSPLQMVQDVVNRVDKEKDNEKKEDTGDKSEEKKKDEGNNEKETREEKSGRKDSEPCVKTDKEQTKPEESQTETDNGKETKSAEGDANANEVAKQISSTPTSISTSTVSSAPQIILHQGQSMPTTTMSFTTGTPTTNEFGMRYPIIQTIQPFFSTGGPLIFSSPQQTTQTQDVQNQGQGGQGQTQNQNQQHHPQQQSFIYHPQDQQLVNMQDPNSTFTMPFTFDPSSSTLCAQNLNSIISGMSPLTLQAGPNVPNSPPGNKKKKKRLSKKQQQQQAQIQLQQQLLIQQIQAQQQAQQALNAAFPLTIFNNSFPLNFQPMNMNMNMPFFQPQTILTLPNLILNPADGTLFLQPSAPMSTTTTSTIQPASAIINRGGQTTPTLLQPGNPLIAPKKDGSEGTTTPKSDAGSDDLRRNNPTPDSSTGDVVQLAILSNNGNTPTSLNTSTTTTPIPSPIIVGSGGGQTILPQTNKKTSIKSRAVVSSTIKRVFHQKQILPKIDSTTPPND